MRAPLTGAGLLALLGTAILLIAVAVLRVAVAGVRRLRGTGR